MARDAEKIDAGIKHLRRRDPVMRAVIDAVGPFTLKPARDRFGNLVGAIIGQQISTGAARSIRGRLRELVAPEKITPHALARLDHDRLRSAGLSNQKATYLKDLTRNVLDGDVRLDRMGRHADEEVIERLVRVKGIGRWTAQMFLIFSLRRLDVFPFDDLGVRSAMRDLYGLDDLPDREAGHEIAESWRPFASIASWYCWRSIELSRDGKPVIPL